jgi:hypothetical protein
VTTQFGGEGRPASLGVPARVRLSRAKGFRLQEHAPGAVVVRRPTRWGNPFTVADVLKDDPTLTEVQARECCTGLFDLWLDGLLVGVDDLAERRAWILGHIGDLTGRPLACTCPLPGPGAPDWCHGAVLLRHANPDLAEPVPALTTAWAGAL